MIPCPRKLLHMSWITHVICFGPLMADLRGLSMQKRPGKSMQPVVNEEPFTTHNSPRLRRGWKTARRPGGDVQTLATRGWGGWWVTDPARHESFCSSVVTVLFSSCKSIGIFPGGKPHSKYLSIPHLKSHISSPTQKKKDYYSTRVVQTNMSWCCVLLNM